MLSTADNGRMVGWLWLYVVGEGGGQRGTLLMVNKLVSNQ